MRAYSAERDQPVRSPKAFLFRIARNVALNELARKSRLLTDYIEDSTSLGIEDKGPTPEQHVINQQRLEVFCQAVAVLPPQCRRAFLLRKVYGLSHKEIAAEMGISVSTVEKHIAQGLRRCSTYVRNEGRTVDNVSQLPVERIQQQGNGGP